MILVSPRVSEGIGIWCTSGGGAGWPGSREEALGCRKGGQRVGHRCRHLGRPDGEKTGAFHMIASLFSQK